MSNPPKESNFDWIGAENAGRRLAFTDHYSDWTPAYSMGEHDDWYARVGFGKWEWHSSNAHAWASRRKYLTIIRFYDDSLITPDAISPQHYHFPGGVEAIHLAQHLSFALGNVVKYVARAGRKPGVDALQDLDKAAEYLRIEHERLQALGAEQ